MHDTMPPRPYRVLLTLPVRLLLCTTASLAQERYGLRAGFPLRVEDARPTQRGKIEAEFVAHYAHTDQGQDRFTLQPEVKWGVAPHWDLQVNTQWNCLREQTAGWWPALAGEVQVDVPTGKRSEGLDTTLQVIATKTLTGLTAQDQLHVNVSWIQNADRRAEERADRYIAMLGYSRRLARSTVCVADFVPEQQRERGQDANLIELGVVQELTQTLKLAVGVGAGIGEESPDVTGSLGVQWAFSPGAGPR